MTHGECHELNMEQCVDRDLERATECLWLAMGTRTG